MQVPARVTRPAGFASGFASGGPAERQEPYLFTNGLAVRMTSGQIISRLPFCH